MAQVVGMALAIGALVVGCGSSGRDIHGAPNVPDSVGGQSGAGTGAGGVLTGGLGGAAGLVSIGGLSGGAGAGGAGNGGRAGAPMFPPRPICGGSISSGNEVWCIGIENVALSEGALTDAGGDGRVSPGEEASVVIVMRNDGTTGYNDPCVGLFG